MNRALTSETSAHAEREPKWVAMATGGPGGSLAPYTVAVVSWLTLACLGLAFIFLVSAFVAAFVFGFGYWLGASIDFFSFAVVLFVVCRLFIVVMRPRPY